MLLKVNEMFNVIAQWQSEFTGIIYTDTGTICQKFWPLMYKSATELTKHQF